MKTQAEKTVRALEVYLELLDAAEYMRRWMRPPLDAFDLTMERFRLLVYLCRDGAMPMTMAAKKLQLRRGNVNRVVEPLEERGFVQRQTRRYAAAERKASKLSKAEREEERVGREFVLVRLTTRGRQFLECVLPRHAKVVKALMRALDGREQETLGELCRRLRAGDALKFASEMTHAEEWQDIGVEEEEETEEAQEAEEKTPFPAACEVKEVEEVNEVKEVKEKETTSAAAGSPRDIQPGADASLGSRCSPRDADPGRIGTQVEAERVRGVEEARRIQAEVDEWLAKDQRKAPPRPRKFARKRWQNR